MPYLNWMFPRTRRQHWLLELLPRSSRHRMLLRLHWRLRPSCHSMRLLQHRPNRELGLPVPERCRLFVRFWLTAHSSRRCRIDPHSVVSVMVKSPSSLARRLPIRHLALVLEVLLRRLAIPPRLHLQEADPSRNQSHRDWCPWADVCHHSILHSVLRRERPNRSHCRDGLTADFDWNSVTMKLVARRRCRRVSSRHQAAADRTFL
jgi:hypothetical protein